MKTVIFAIVAVLIVIGIYLNWRGTYSNVQTISLPIQTVPAQSTPFALTIVIKDKGEFLVEGVRMDFEGVKRVIAAKKWDENAALKVKSESRAVFQEAVAILDFARQCGVIQTTLE